MPRYGSNVGYYADYHVPICLASIGTAGCNTTWEESYADVLVTGSGGSAFAADPASVDFGDVALNTPATKSVTLTVDRGYGVYESSGSGAPFSLDSDTCSGFTGPGTCTINIGFKPFDTGSASGGYAVRECPDVLCQTFNQVSISLRGNGVSAFAASPASVDFGDIGVNTPAYQEVTVTCTAGAILRSSSPPASTRRRRVTSSI